ncbi:hypothetical protein LINPERPRIM_LOCUS35286, partial [Linum perenne]
LQLSCWAPAQILSPSSPNSSIFVRLEICSKPGNPSLIRIPCSDVLGFFSPFPAFTMVEHPSLDQAQEVA